MSKYPDKMIGITSRKPNSKYHYCLVDIDHKYKDSLLETINFLCPDTIIYPLFVYSTPSGFHIIYLRDMPFNNWYNLLSKLECVDKNYLKIAEKRGYFFLNNFPRACMLLPNIEYMELSK